MWSKDSKIVLLKVMVLRSLTVLATGPLPKRLVLILLIHKESRDALGGLGRGLAGRSSTADILTVISVAGIGDRVLHNVSEAVELGTVRRHVVNEHGARSREAIVEQIIPAWTKPSKSGVAVDGGEALKIAVHTVGDDEFERALLGSLADVGGFGSVLCEVGVEGIVGEIN